METGTIELIIIGILGALLVFQAAFQAWQTHRLLNKLMSRNYAEYQLVNHPPKQVENGFRVEMPDEDQHESLRALNDMVRF